VKKAFQLDVELDFEAVFPCETMPAAEDEFEYAKTIWSDAKPTAQLADRFFKYFGPVAASDTEMKMSSGAPAAIRLASAKDPPDFTGATGIPVLCENPPSREEASTAYASAENETRGDGFADVVGPLPGVTYDR
jgi:hypothetical protein